MASKTTQSANDVVNYLVRNAGPSWGGASALYLSLHTGAIGLGGNQTTNEATYTPYSRVALNRNPTTGAFDAAAAGIALNNALIQFAKCTGGTLPETLTHVALGENASGTGTVIVSAALASSLVVNVNIQPQFPIGTLGVKEQ
jgi:hypothetical protein